MTNYYLGLNNVQGVADSGPTIATSTQSKDVEININGSNVLDKMTAITLVEKLLLFLTSGDGNATATGGWPPM